MRDIDLFFPPLAVALAASTPAGGCSAVQAAERLWRVPGRPSSRLLTWPLRDDGEWRDPPSATPRRSETFDQAEVVGLEQNQATISIAGAPGLQVAS